VKNPFSGELQVATEDHVNLRWFAKDPGEGFVCGICGKKIEVGDRWRGVMANVPGSGVRKGNFLVCGSCHDEAEGNDKHLCAIRSWLENAGDDYKRMGLV
jgi:hypothetical protein